MKTTNLPSPSERLEHYKLALEALRENKGYDDYGLCIVLGDIVYEDFVLYAPWDCFEDLQIYYPELTKPVTNCDLHHLDNIPEALAAIQECIGILERAIEQVERLIKMKEAIRDMSPEDKEKFFPEDTTPKGWVSVEDHLPMWMASDIRQGGSKYKVKTADGHEGWSFVSDHNVWYHMAKEQGITHWWNN